MISFKTFLESVQDDRMYRSWAVKAYIRLKVMFKRNKLKVSDRDDYRIISLKKLIPNWEGDNSTIVLYIKDYAAGTSIETQGSYTKLNRESIIYIKNAYDTLGNFLVNRSNFVHEFTHAFDFGGNSDPTEIFKKRYKGFENKDGRGWRDDDDKFLDKYYNSGWEYNANYQAGIDQFERFYQKKGPKFLKWIRNFKNFEYFFRKKYMRVSVELDVDNHKRLWKRLYSYHQEFMRRIDE